MKFAAVFALALFAQTPQSAPPHAAAPQATAQTAPQPSADAAPPSAPLPPPWDGTLAEGLAEVRKLARSNQLDAASALCERLLAPGEFARWRESLDADGGWKRGLTRALDPAFDVLGLSDRTAPERAEVLYAAGLVSASAEQRTRGEDEFGRARAVAGPGALRLESGYQLGTTALLEGESWRAQIPEIQARSGAAPGGPAHAQPPSPQPSAAPGQEPPPDPLAQARTAYLRARERFVERLRADWRDADTRANTELVLRRLKELDEIEQQRKEQQQKDEQDKQKDPNQQKSDQDKSQDKQDKQDQDKPQNPQDKQDENAPPNEPPKPEEPKPDEAQAKQDPPKPDEQKPGEQPDPAQMEERQLTKEEMMRLLDILEQREEQWKKLQQQVQQRRPRAKKDW